MAKKKNATLWIAGQNLPVPIKHKYRQFKQLGVDRAINIYGALKIYRSPFVILDYGTALTVDYVNKKGVFEGGMIVPGPELSFQALLDRAALIPSSIRLPKKAGPVLGRTTHDCLRSGVLRGYGAMTDGIIDRLKSLYGKKIRFISTGGFIQHLKPHIRSKLVIDPLHSLKSLLLLYKSQKI